MADTLNDRHTVGANATFQGRVDVYLRGVAYDVLSQALTGSETARDLQRRAVLKRILQNARVEAVAPIARVLAAKLPGGQIEPGQTSTVPSDAVIEQYAETALDYVFDLLSFDDSTPA